MGFGGLDVRVLIVPSVQPMARASEKVESMEEQELNGETERTRMRQDPGTEEGLVCLYHSNILRP